MASRLEENKIATRYARALFESAVESGSPEKLFKDLTTLQEVIQAIPELLPFLSNPSIPTQEKQAFLDSQFTKKSNVVLLNLLKIMVDNDRISAFPLVVERYQDLLNELENVTTAEVVTAFEVAAPLEKKIKNALEATFGFNRVDLHKRVDPGLLGGVMIKIQDKVIDGSFVGKLESMRKQIAG